MAYIQLSLFGRTSWELFHRETGWILEPCWKRSQAARFQCLLLNTGPAPVWCEGAKVISVGGSWTPSIGEAPGSSSEENGYSLWRILEESVAPRYYLSAAQCSRILRYAASLGCRPPERVEYFLKKQGGRYPSSFRYRSGKCAEQSKKKTKPSSSSVLDGQMSLFPHFLLAAQTASASGMKEKTGEKREVSDT